LPSSEALRNPSNKGGLAAFKLDEGNSGPFAANQEPFAPPFPPYQWLVLTDRLTILVRKTNGRARNLTISP